MFGYIKPFKPQLRICEYDMYKAVYCGLCHQLGKSFGAASRLTLSYDFTFLSMLHYTVSRDMPSFAPCRCCVNPLVKQMTCQSSEMLCYSADTAILMLYYKLLDNIQDGGMGAKISGSLVRPLVGHAHKNAALRRPECEEVVAGSMKNQAALEQARCDSVDAASEPTATALAGICRTLSDEVGQQRILERLGYCVGRYVYLCDALDDLEDDVTKGGYNPLALRHHVTASTPKDALEPIYLAAKQSLNATIAECAKAYDLLDEGPFHPVLLNIFTMGMQASVSEILAKKEKNP